MEISYTDRVRNEEVLRRVKGEECPAYSRRKEGRLNGLVTSCVGTAFSDTLLTER